MKKITDIPTKDLVEALGCTPQLVSAVKNGHKRFGYQHALKIHNVFGVPLHEIRPDIYPAEILKGDVPA